ncbi:MAG: thioredoxin domain-containing protein [Candidatus Binatia bacterium]|nr:thioredoxin domain-containing protein [Candidatus Binatia bacterium]
MHSLCSSRQERRNFMRRIMFVLCGLMFVVPQMARSADEVVATVGERKITRSELEKHVKPKLVQLDNQRFQVLQEGLEELVADELYKLEAKTRGISVDALVKQELEAKVGEPSQEEIEKLYDDNKEDLEGQSLEQLRPQLVQYLKQQKLAERHQQFLGELRKKYKTTVALKPPVVEVGDGGRPSRGPASAPVTIIEFSDYECPFCKRASSTVAEVLRHYGDKVRFVHRDFPLSFHQHARLAAEAAACANAQGKFWEYHDRLWKAQDLSEPSLKGLAKEIGLDEGKFAECLKTKPHSAAIDRDLEEGTAAGVNGTPAFFINGRMLSGAQPFEAFKQLIDEELSRAEKKS